jgi:hypothetical protein
MKPKSHTSSDGKLSFLITPSEDGNTKLGFKGFDWSILAGDIVGIYGVPNEVAVNNYLNALLQNELVLNIWRRGSDIVNVSIMGRLDRIPDQEKAHAEGLTLEHRYWDGTTWVQPKPDMTLDQHAAVLKKIPGGEELISWYGGAPTFGDGEILKFHLNTHAPSTLHLRIDKLVRGETPDDDRFEDAMVIFTFQDLIDVKLEGFSHPNVIGGITLSEVAPSPIHESLRGFGLMQGDILMTFEPCAGAYGTIRTNIVRITFEPEVNDD